MMLYEIHFFYHIFGYECLLDLKCFIYVHVHFSFYRETSVKMGKASPPRRALKVLLRHCNLSETVEWYS